MSPEISTDQSAAPQPKLLMELEPAHRVFIRNLGDLFAFRAAAPEGITWLPAPFWDDVFIRSSLPWWGFLESMLWHMLIVAALWSVSQYWSLQKFPQQRRNLHSYITYYPPSKSYPAIASSPPRVRPPAQRHENAKATRSMRVAREPARGGGREGSMAPPDIKMGGGGSPELGGSGAAPPSMPLSATGQPRLTVPTDLAEAVGPPAEIGGAIARRGGLPEAGVVAPAPEIGSVSSRRGVSEPTAGVVGPPPTVEGALRQGGDINIGPSEVVAPSPRLPMHEQRAGTDIAGGVGGTGSEVVPPPPSVQRSDALGLGHGGAQAGSGSGVQVVAPPASVEGVGSSRRGRGNGNTIAGVQVVPPPPSLQGAGGPGGRGGRGGSMSGMGVQVVPPPPSVREAGNSYGNGRGGTGSGSGSGAGTPVVGPPPSTEGLGNSLGGGRGGSLGGTGLVAGAPGQGLGGTGQGRGNSGTGTGAGTGTGSGTGSGSGSQAGSGGSGTGQGGVNGNGIGQGQGESNGTGTVAGGQGSGGQGGNANGNGGNGSGGSGSGSGTQAGSGAGEGSAETAQSGRPADNGHPPVPVELPVRVIGLALKLPSTSYFSNYEVFFAERRVGKAQAELIKLVYVYLPYQRRLTEYGLNDTKVFKLRVIRDPSCDESLLQMTWPEAEQAQNKAAGTNGDTGGKLPCYRTTADDYKRAMGER